MNTLPIRHRRPRCHWHTNTLEITEECFPGKRRIRLSLDDGDVAIELSIDHALELANMIVDTIEEGN